MTRRICSLVSLSAMTMMLCVTGSTEMIALPTVPLLLYWLLLELLALRLRVAKRRRSRRIRQSRRIRRRRRPRCCAWSSNAAHNRRIRTPPRYFLKQFVFIICLFIEKFFMF